MVMVKIINDRTFSVDKAYALNILSWLHDEWYKAWSENENLLTCRMYPSQMSRKQSLRTYQVFNISPWMKGWYWASRFAKELNSLYVVSPGKVRGLKKSNEGGVVAVWSVRTHQHSAIYEVDEFIGVFYKICTQALVIYNYITQFNSFCSNSYK